jgi:hypothetical protein
MRILASLLLLLPALAYADDGLTPQQKRMRECNTRADQKELARAERNHFMSSCLKGADGDGRRLTAHQQRNQACNRVARERKLEGAERRGFMSECEKSDRVKRDTAERERAKSCERRAKDRRLDGEDKQKYMNGCRDGAAS